MQKHQSIFGKPPAEIAPDRGYYDSVQRGISLQHRCQVHIYEIHKLRGQIFCCICPENCLNQMLEAAKKVLKRKFDLEFEPEADMK